METYLFTLFNFFRTYNIHDFLDFRVDLSQKKKKNSFRAHISAPLSDTDLYLRRDNTCYDAVLTSRSWENIGFIEVITTTHPWPRLVAKYLKCPLPPMLEGDQPGWGMGAVDTRRARARAHKYVCTYTVVHIWEWGVAHRLRTTGRNCIYICIDNIHYIYTNSWN